MKLFFILLLHMLLIGLFTLNAYLPSIGMDVFPWGDSRYTGEFKIGLIILFPITILCILLKWIVNKRLADDSRLRYSWAYYLGLLLSSTFILIVADEKLTYLMAMGISLVAVVFLLFETRVLFATSCKRNKERRIP
jgi:hypothetical protein